VKTKEEVLDSPTGQKLPQDVRDRILASTQTIRGVAPDPGTIRIPISQMQPNCPLLSANQLKIPVVIGVDTSGNVTNVVSVIPGQSINPGIMDCKFNPYTDSNGYPQAVTVVYSPPPTPRTAH
jgi:hypothetical protein